MKRIREIKALPMVTIIRLLGVVKKRLSPESIPPGGEVDENQDSAIIAILEKKMKAREK